MSILICPNCGEPIAPDETGRVLRCPKGHSFDVAKEGYVNLLVGSKNGDRRGDSRESARARHAVLSRDYYGCLKQAVGSRLHGTVLDICCGEGYYDALPPAQPDGTEPVLALYGFDLSKEMVRLASRRYRTSPDHHYFVANLSAIPVADGSVDTAIHLFAPFHEAEFARVLKDDGVLCSVIPGENHLFEMKQILYDRPYRNDEHAPETGELLQLTSRTKVRDTVTVPGDDLRMLFSMTPYYYRTSAEDRARLDPVGELELTVEFVLLEYRKRL